MNHHFDSYHQNQNDFDHLTPADVNSALEKQKQKQKQNHTKPNENPEHSILPFCYTRHSMCKKPNRFLIKNAKDQEKLRKPPDFMHSL